MNIRHHLRQFRQFRQFRQWLPHCLLFSLIGLVGACGDDAPDEPDPILCAATCDTNATCNTSSGTGVCECNTGFMGDGATCTADDPCAMVTNCTVVGDTCSSDTVVTCAADAAGCLVETMTDCAAGGQICDDAAGAMCIDGCSDDPLCEGLAAGEGFCSGSAPTFCETNAEGCLDSRIGNSCGMELCDESLAAPSCVANASGDTCMDAYIVQDNATISGTDFIADFTNAEQDFAAKGCLATEGDTVEAVFTVALTANQTISISELGAIDVVMGILPQCDVQSACYAGADDSSGPVVYTATIDETITVYAEAAFTKPGTADYDIRLTISECGDGVIEGPEVCDDNNASDLDGCSSCVVDFGFTCDNAAVSICTGPIDIGTFAAAETIPDTLGGAFAEGESAFYTITFTEDVFLAGILEAAGGEDVDFHMYDNMGVELFNYRTLAGEDFADELLPAGTYTIEILSFDATPSWILTMSTTPGPVCGDDNVETGEMCDDNMIDGDGCTDCTIDPGFSCSGSPSICILLCGDGQVDGDDGEECDDGNLVDDDRCSDACILNADVVDMELNDTFATAQPLADGEVARGSLDDVMDFYDVYTFTITEPTWITVEEYNTVDSDLDNYSGGGLDNTMDCIGIDPDIRIFDDAGDITDNSTALITDDANGDGSCGYIGQNTDGALALLPAGTYYLKVSDFGSPNVIAPYALDLQLDPVLSLGDMCSVFVNHCDETAVCHALSAVCEIPNLGSDRDNYELFTNDFDLSFTSITFTPNAGSFDIVTSVAAAYPDIPGTGDMSAALMLDDDDNTEVAFGLTFPYFGVDLSSVFVNSNGSLSFRQGNNDAFESTTTHFSIPRISFFYDDLDPTAGGTISSDEYADRLSITFDGIAPFNSTDVINVQVQLFNTGVITITYLEVTETDALVGISAGDNLGMPPLPTDFSAP